jgi:hypothetical protein
MSQKAPSPVTEEEDGGEEGSEGGDSRQLVVKLVRGISERGGLAS